MQEKETSVKKHLCQMRWKSFLVLSECFAMEITLAKNGYFHLSNIVWMDFLQKTRCVCQNENFVFNVKNHPFFEKKENYGSVFSKSISFSFEKYKGKRRIFGRADAFSEGKQLLFDITFPFHFAWNEDEKNDFIGLPASGKIIIGSDEYLIAPAHSGVLIRMGGETDRSVLCCLSDTLQGSQIGVFAKANTVFRNYLLYRGRKTIVSSVFLQKINAENAADSQAVYRFFSEDDRLDVRFQPILSNMEKPLKKRWNFLPCRTYGHFSGRLKTEKVLPIYKQMGFTEQHL